MKKATTYSVVALGIMLSACVSNENSPGLEYMPDMYRSPAIEAYVDYGLDPATDSIDWNEKDLEIMRATQRARKPVAGTVPYHGEGMEMMALPYPFPEPVADYEAAGEQITSPLETTAENVDAGKTIYEKYCWHCHGTEGKGDGPISKHIKGIPDYTTTLKDLPEGKMYHTIYHGKGVMGQHRSQLNVMERWLVIEYVKHLQRGGKMPDEMEGGEQGSADAGEGQDASAESANS